LNKLIRTADGSHTIYVTKLDEHYHSIHGAVQESEHIFIRSGFDTCKADPLNIFEVGFGTGLNALLTATRSLKGDRQVNYTTIEKFPVSEDIIWSLNHSDFAGPEGKKIFNMLHFSDWNKTTVICKNFSLKKIKGDFTAGKLSGEYDLIYFDAFAPDKQPEMWSQEMFANIASITRKDGILVTYSAKGEVKRNLIACGFDVKLIPGPPGKREIIRAVKI
jgi:tRNA U34 5-methylaminomethyl-2-thiouridine-forming methyltransferase MnmC